MAITTKKHMTPRRLLLALLVAGAACGGGKGSTTTPPTAPSVAISAPAEGQLLAGSRAVAVMGSVGGTGVQAVTVALNGGTPAPATVADGAFTGSVTAVDGANTVVVTVTAAAGTVAATGHFTYSSLPTTIRIDSPAEGQQLLGTGANATVTGVASGAGLQTVTVSTNGGTPVTATLTAGSGAFTASLPLADGTNTIVATATAVSGPASASVRASRPFLTLAAFQPASVVIGQSSFTAAAATPAASASTLGRVYGNAGWDGTKLYVPDYEENRVLVFAGVPTANGASASLVLGQGGFTTTSAGTTASTFSGPQTVRVAGTKLLVLEQDNSRVLVYNAIPTASGASAAVAVGSASANLTTTGGGCTSAQLDLPQSFFVVGTKLVVADSGNNRVLVWNTIPTSSGRAADVVIGQTSFTSCDPNRSATVGAAPTAGSLSYPSDVWSDGTRLYVADTGNNRILGWNAIPATSGVAADFVIGQASMTASAAATTATGLSRPTFLTSNGNQLFVADSGNSRVLVWNTLPVAAGAPPLAAAPAASVVLGQADFTHGASNDDDQDGFADAAPTARTLAEPSGLTLVDGGLVVGDYANDRYLVFKRP